MMRIAPKSLIFVLAIVLVVYLTITILEFSVQTFQSIASSM